MLRYSVCLTEGLRNLDLGGSSNVMSVCVCVCKGPNETVIKLSRHQRYMHVWSVYFNCTVNRAASDNQAIMNCKWSRVIDWPSTGAGLPMSMLHQAAPFFAMRWPLTVSLSLFLLSRALCACRRGFTPSPPHPKKPIIRQAFLIVWLNGIAF